MTSKAFLMIREDRTLKRVGFFVLCCLVPLVKSQTDLRPRNVTFTFGNDFCVIASWAPPEGIDGMGVCEYEHCIVPSVPCPKYKNGNFKDINTTYQKVSTAGYTTPKFYLKTICNDTSGAVNVTITTNPELVHDFQCVLHSSKDASCSWTPSSHVSNLRLFWTSSKKVGDCRPLNLKECEILPHQDNVKRVCHISEKNLFGKDIHFLFNGTQDDMFVKNTFKRSMRKNVSLPALNWTLVENDNKLIINWTASVPDIFTDEWEYQIDYTECDKRKTHRTKAGVKLVSLPFDADCQYKIKLKASFALQYSSTPYKGETQWSDEKSYGHNRPRDAPMITVAVIAPLLVATVLFLAFCAVKKYKVQFFPKVPVPSKSLLQDLLDNNNKHRDENLYIPKEVVEDTKICLVAETP